MRDLNKRIDELQSQLKKHRRTGLKEYPTRTIFIDPLLGTLGWDVRDPDEVELEYPARFTQCPVEVKGTFTNLTPASLGITGNVLEATGDRESTVQLD